jgi:hypothetical protein
MITAQRRRARMTLAAGLPLAFACVLIARGCASRDRLVEQFDNGPLLPGGFSNPGPSEGYYWVRESDGPSPGKQWRQVDPDTLTTAQRKQIHGWAWR